MSIADAIIQLSANVLFFFMCKVMNLYFHFQTLMRSLVVCHATKYKTASNGAKILQTAIT